MVCDHPLYTLLHDEPNPEMTSFVFRETLMSHLLIWGNAYSQIIRNGKGGVLSLYPLLPNTFRELNQIAMEIQNLADKTTVSRNKLLASLEAEVLRDADAACQIFRNYKDYEFLPIQELSAEGYAKYLLNLHQIYIEKELEPHVRLREFGLQKMKEKGLAEYLYSELLKKRVASMMPDVEADAGSLWGVLTVRTYGELNDRKLAAVMEEWKAMADSGWGEELFYRPIRTEKGEIYIGFWDTDNNDNQFIKTEEEFRRDCLDGSQIGQELQI